MSKPIIDAMARGMRSSKAWPVVFGAGAADELALAALQEIECMGYAVVPIVPTDAMIDAPKVFSHFQSTDDMCRAIYHAMVSAAADKQRTAFAINHLRPSPQSTVAAVRSFGGRK